MGLRWGRAVDGVGDGFGDGVGAGVICLIHVYIIYALRYICTLSYVILCCRISLNIIIYFHISPYVILYNPMESYGILYIYMYIYILKSFDKQVSMIVHRNVCIYIYIYQIMPCIRNH